MSGEPESPAARRERLQASLPKDESIDAALLAEIERLAAFDPVEFELVADAVAQRLAVKVAVLKRAVVAARKRTAKAPPIAEPQLFERTELWSEPVDSAALFDDMLRLVQRFTICDEPYAVVAVLWCAMSWCMSHLRVAPFAMITAPTMGAGKTVMLEVMSLMAYRSFIASSTTEAVLFRLLDKEQVTLFLDESDRALPPQKQELIGILNASYSRRSAVTSRCEGDDHVPRTFSTWGAKAFAGIGGLEDTLASRSVRIEMRRKLPHEKIANIRKPNRSTDEAFAVVRQKLARFAADVAADAFERDPAMPPGLENRGEELWMALCSVAELAGGTWPQRACEAALYAIANHAPAQSNAEELLESVNAAFDVTGSDFLTSEKLIAALCVDSEAPWKTLNRGLPITARQLAKRLKPFGIGPRQTRRPGELASNLRGYKRSELEDAFERYRAPSPHSEGAATHATAPESLRLNSRDSRHVALVSDVAAATAGSSNASEDDHVFPIT